MNLGIIRKLGNMAVTVSREGFHRYKYNTHEIAHDLKPYKLYKTISLTEIPKKHIVKILYLMSLI